MLLCVSSWLMLRLCACACACVFMSVMQRLGFNSVLQMVRLKNHSKSQLIPFCTHYMTQAVAGSSRQQQAAAVFTRVRARHTQYIMPFRWNTTTITTMTTRFPTLLCIKISEKRLIAPQWKNRHCSNSSTHSQLHTPQKKTICNNCETRWTFNDRMDKHSALFAHSTTVNHIVVWIKLESTHQISAWQRENNKTNSQTENVLKKIEKIFTASICREFGSKFFLFKLETKWLICVKVNDKASWFIVSHLQRHWESSNTTRCRWSSHLRIECSNIRGRKRAGSRDSSGGRSGATKGLWDDGGGCDLIWSGRVSLWWLLIIVVFVLHWNLLSIHCTALHNTPQWFTARECQSCAHARTHMRLQHAPTLFNCVVFCFFFFRSFCCCFCFSIEFRTKSTIYFVFWHSHAHHFFDRLLVLSTTMVVVRQRLKSQLKMKVKRKRLEKFKLFPLEKAVKLDSFCQFTRSATKKAKWGESIERAKDDIDDSQMMDKKRKRKRNEKCNVIRMQMI